MRTEDLNKIRHRIDSLRPEDIAVLVEEISAMKAKLTQQEQTIAALERDALTDALTGLPNRRAFELEMTRALSNARRYGRVHALLMVDLDNFKYINDTYGHLAGDHVLMHVAQVLQENVRESDVVARLGGDEFCVILTEVQAETYAYRRARALEAMLRRAPCLYNGAALPVGGSVGCQIFGGQSDMIEILTRADSDMYAHKQQRA